MLLEWKRLHGLVHIYYKDLYFSTKGPDINNNFYYKSCCFYDDNDDDDKLLIHSLQ